MANKRTLGQLRRWRVFGYTPNGWADEHVHGRPERFICATTGRQVGKTVTAAMEIDAGMNQPADLQGPPHVGVLGSTYEKAEISVNRYIELLTNAFGKASYRVNQNKHELVIVDPVAGTVGARLKWMSAEDVYGTVGFTFSKVIIDEAQAVPDAVFTKLRPTLDVRDAPLLVFGTPDTTVAQTWFESMWLRGQDSDEENYHSLSVASWDTPWMSEETIDDAKASIAEAEFRRLYGGEWVKDVGRVFTNPRAGVLGEVHKYAANKKYIMAVDFAMHEDFNVVMVAEAATRIVVFRERWHHSDAVTTYDRMQDIWERYGRPWVYADATGMGLPMIAELRFRGLRVVPVTITGENKMQLIHQLEADIQHRRIMYPNWEDLMREFEAFVYHRTPSGKLTAASAGAYHDDLVMALVLLNHGLHQKSGLAGALRAPINYLKG